MFIYSHVALTVPWVLEAFLARFPVSNLSYGPLLFLSCGSAAHCSVGRPMLASGRSRRDGEINLCYPGYTYGDAHCIFQGLKIVFWYSLGCSFSNFLGCYILWYLIGCVFKVRENHTPAKLVHTAGTYPGSLSMKPTRSIATPPGWDTCPSQVMRSFQVE